jgi:O-antigen ligase
MIGTTATAAGDFFPFGSGVGTFPDIYRWYEDPASVNSTWVNHAHGDVVEILLETGLLGLLLMLAFLIWWSRRAYAVWSSGDRPDHFARAAMIASAAIIAHSFVDYPLRTAAISTLFAVCLALMGQPRPSAKARASRGDDEDAMRHLSA